MSGRVEEIHPGPVVTMYEFEPKSGTKVSKVAGLADDLAHGRSRQKVRIVAPIPGKSRIGFELPNEHRLPVSLRELVEDERWQKLDGPLPVVLGRTSSASPYYADLAQDAARARRRRDRRRQERGPQRHARVAALQAHARGAAPADDRPEGRRARAVRRHPAHAAAGRHRHEAGGARAALGGRRDGAPLPALRRRRHAEHHHLQRRVERCSRGEMPVEQLVPKRAGKVRSIGPNGEEIWLGPTATSSPTPSCRPRSCPTS